MPCLLPSQQSVTSVPHPVAFCPDCRAALAEPASHASRLISALLPAHPCLHSFLLQPAAWSPAAPLHFAPSTHPHRTTTHLNPGCTPHAYAGCPHLSRPAPLTSTPSTWIPSNSSSTASAKAMKASTSAGAYSTKTCRTRQERGSEGVGRAHGQAVVEEKRGGGEAWWWHGHGPPAWQLSGIADTPRDGLATALLSHRTVHYCLPKA